jgi:hypothetical protein
VSFYIEKMGKYNNPKKKKNNNNRLSLRDIKQKANKENIKPSDHRILHTLLTGPIFSQQNDPSGHFKRLPISTGPAASTSSYRARSEAKALAAMEEEEASGRVMHALNEMVYIPRKPYAAHSSRMQQSVIQPYIIQSSQEGPSMQSSQVVPSQQATYQVGPSQVDLFQVDLFQESPAQLGSSQVDLSQLDASQWEFSVAQQQVSTAIPVCLYNSLYRKKP